MTNYKPYYNNCQHATDIFMAFLYIITFELCQISIWKSLIEKRIVLLEGIMISLKQKFGKRVRELRKSKSLTQESLAELMNMEPSNVSKLECGLHFPQPEKIEKLAKILDVDVQNLFEFDHFNKKQDLIKYIDDSIENFDLRTLELVYKFVYNLKLYK